MIGKLFSGLFGARAKELESTEERNVTNHVSRVHSSNSRRITAKELAFENNIEYIKNAQGKKVYPGEDYVNQFYVVNDRYILLHPPNDGMPTCPIEWYGKFDGENKMIMDNQSSFKCITNLSDILLQMVRLYAKYLDEDVFIAFSGFAVKLEEEVCPDYIGKASLVLTADVIPNNKVKSEQVLDAKKFFINCFLDHFIGWNFGVAVKNNAQLEKELLELNNLVINKGLRQNAGPGFEVWCSEDVQDYDMRTS